MKKKRKSRRCKKRKEEVKGNAVKIFTSVRNSERLYFV